MVAGFEFDAIDLRILRALQRDSRLTNVALAEEAGISPSPCLRRVRRLEESGVIDRYVTVLSTERVGLNILAFVSIRINDHGRTKSQEFLTKIQAIPEVLACYILTGDTDFIAQVISPDLKSYSELMMSIGDIEGVRDLQSSIVIETCKTMGPLPLTHLA